MLAKGNDSIQPSHKQFLGGYHTVPETFLVDKRI